MKSYKITESARKRFKVWLVKNNITLVEFAKKCEVSRNYIYKILNGQRNITKSVLETFRKGGYELLWLT